MEINVPVYLSMEFFLNSTYNYSLQESSISPRIKEPLTVRVKNLTENMIKESTNESASPKSVDQPQPSPDGAKKAKIGNI